MRAASLLQGRVLSSKVPAVPKSFAPPPRRVVVVGRSSIAPTATAHRRGRAQNVRTAAAPERRDEVSAIVFASFLPVFLESADSLSRVRFSRASKERFLFFFFFTLTSLEHVALSSSKTNINI